MFLSLSSVLAVGILAEGNYKPSMKPMLVPVPGGNGFVIAEGINGIFMLPSRDYGVSRHIIEHGEFEQPYIDSVLSLLPPIRPGTVYLDIGASNKL